MLPSPAPRFYIIGALLSAAGAVVIALRAGKGKRSPSRPWALLVVGVLVVVLGGAMVGVGLWTDAQYNARLNTTSLWFEVSVTMNATQPVRITLPAPSDGRFFDALNITNGSSSLRLDHTGTATDVVLTTYGNVSFQVHVQVPTTAVNWSFTRVQLVGVGPEGPFSTATIEMITPFAGFGVFLDLYASVGSGCTTRTLSLESWIRPGVADYPAQTPTVTC